MAKVIELWRGAVEPAEGTPSGKEIQAWRGAVEPAAPVAGAAPGARARLVSASKLNQSILTRGINL